MLSGLVNRSEVPCGEVAVNRLCRGKTKRFAVLYWLQLTMSLLPRTAEEFSSAEYWERFFKKRGEKAFEWYGDYNKLCGVLHKYIKVQDKVMMLSMGTAIHKRSVSF